MSRYSKRVEILFSVAKISGKWEHDELDMPACLAAWLDFNDFPPHCDVTVFCTVRGKYTGFDGDDEHEFVCHGAKVGQTVIPPAVLNCALSGEWEDHFASELLDGPTSTCATTARCRWST